jgi:hypothetical protein
MSTRIILSCPVLSYSIIMYTIHACAARHLVLKPLQVQREDQRRAVDREALGRPRPEHTYNARPHARTHARTRWTRTVKARTARTAEETALAENGAWGCCYVEARTRRRRRRDRRRRRRSRARRNAGRDLRPQRLHLYLLGPSRISFAVNIRSAFSTCPPHTFIPAHGIVTAAQLAGRGRAGD